MMFRNGKTGQPKSMPLESKSVFEEFQHGALFVVLILFSLVCLGMVTPAAAEQDPLWEALKGGNHAALLRHALAPGTGDPPGFAIEDCSTQRNLSEQGREQAQRIGDRFQENSIARAQIYSSQWCRCLETARLLGLGPVRELPVLNSFFQRYERRDEQTRKLREWLFKQNLDQVHVLVTHQVNITALTGVFPASGELVIIRVENGTISVQGRIETK